jgi:nitric oxide reductase subunit B
METLVWLRVPGDIVFAAGSLLLALYACRLIRPTGRQAQGVPAGAATATAKR